MGLLDETVEVVVLPTNEDPWSAIALRTEAIAEREGWHDDEAPTGLYWLHEHDDVGGLGPAIAVAVPQFPEGRFPSLHPVPLLEMLARRMVRPPRDLAGFVLVTEAWAVVQNRDDVAGTKYVEALGAERRLHQHPGRIEVRQAHLIMLAPRHERLVFRLRGAEPEVHQVGPEYEGAVPDAVRGLATTLRLRRYGRKG